MVRNSTEEGWQASRSSVAAEETRRQSGQGSGSGGGRLSFVSTKGTMRRQKPWMLSVPKHLRRLTITVAAASAVIRRFVTRFMLFTSAPDSSVRTKEKGSQRRESAVRTEGLATVSWRGGRPSKASLTLL